jgi:TrmH family RNA methyltransferase
MITIRKLASLPTVTALRKSARLLQGFEVDLRLGKFPDPGYLKDLISFISESPALTAKNRIRIDIITSESNNSQDVTLRICNRLRHLLLTHLNEEPADWDFLPSEGNWSDENKIEKRHILPFEVYLDDIRSPFNVGSIFRSSESFGISKILISSGTASPTHRRALRTSMGCTDIIPWENGDCRNLLNRNIFALELNGEPVDQFKFPDNGIVIIGSEELGVSPECLRMADKSFGRVSIPVAGTKGSINVSVAFGILMYNWYNRICKL